jgi:outer membrane immunogenic protein
VYAGVYGAWAPGKSDVATTQEGFGYFGATSRAAINEAGTFQLKPKGPIFGGQVGFNRQSGSAIVGIEADFGFSMVENDAEDDRVTTEYPCCAGKSFTIEHATKTKWLFTMRPRAGIAAGSAFVYATGGLAITRFDFASIFTDTLASARADATRSENRVGWTVGGGLEGRMGVAGSFKVEYLYADFGSLEASTDNLTVASIPVPMDRFEFTATLKVNIVRAGVNYRF